MGVSTAEELLNCCKAGACVARNAAGHGTLQASLFTPNSCQMAENGLKELPTWGLGMRSDSPLIWVQLQVVAPQSLKGMALGRF